jgi:hypothetical protein
MIIVSGRIYVMPGRRDAFLASALSAVAMARRAVRADVSRHMVASSGPP